MNETEHGLQRTAVKADLATSYQVGDVRTRSKFQMRLQFIFHKRDRSISTCHIIDSALSEQENMFVW